MLKQRILIETEDTTLQRRYTTPKGKYAYRKYKQLPTKSFFDKLIDHPFVLPQNTRFHKSYGFNTHLFVTEYEPQMRTINFNMSYASKWEVFLRWCERKNIKQEEAEKFLEQFGQKYTRKRTFQLLFPYIIMVTLINQKERYSNVYMFLNQKPMVNLKTTVYKMPMYNVTTSQTVCMSTGFPQDVYKVPIVDAINMIFKAYFNSTFNSDYSYNMRSYRYRQMFNNYFIWAYVSLNDPFKIFKQKLVRYKSIGGVIEDDIEKKYRFNRSAGISDLASVF